MWRYAATIAGLLAATSPSCVSTGSPGTVLAIRKMISVASSTIAAAISKTRGDVAQQAVVHSPSLPHTAWSLDAKRLATLCLPRTMIRARQMRGGERAGNWLDWPARCGAPAGDRRRGPRSGAAGQGARRGQRRHAGARHRHQRFHHLRPGARGAIHRAAEPAGGLRVTGDDVAGRLSGSQAGAGQVMGTARRMARAGASIWPTRNSTAAIRSPQTT